MNNKQTALTFEQVWSQYEARKNRKKVPHFVPYAAALILFAMLFTPPAQAFVHQLVKVTNIKQANNASFGFDVHSVKNEMRGGYNSAEDAEKVLKQSILYPRNISAYETNVVNRAFNVGVLQNTNTITSYQYTLRSDERMIDISATHNLAQEPDIWFKTTKDLHKTEMNINGANVTIMSAAEYNGGLAYVKKGEWKIVIQILSQGVGAKEASAYKEQEMVKLIESMQ